jgi:hypothetical protein
MHTRRVSIALAFGLAIALLAVVFISAYASRPADQIIPWREINFAQASVPAAQPAVPQAGDFLIECADCPREFDDSSDRMLRLDSLGDPHLAYGRDHLYYTWRVPRQDRRASVILTPYMERLNSPSAMPLAGTAKFWIALLLAAPAWRWMPAVTPTSAIGMGGT